MVMEMGPVTTFRRGSLGLLVAAMSLTSCGESPATPTATDTNSTQTTSEATGSTPVEGASTTTSSMPPTSPAETTASEESSTTEPDPGDDVETEAGAEAGTLKVRLAPVEGFFIEGFEVGLRFETSDGEILYTTLWTEYVRAQDDDSIEAYYETVLSRAVPAGDIVVLATANVGLGPGPVIPDPNGTLDCRLVVAVPAAGEATVEVSFTGNGECLTQP